MNAETLRTLAQFEHLRLLMMAPVDEQQHQAAAAEERLELWRAEVGTPWAWLGV